MLVAHYPLTADTNDYSGNNNHATNNGATIANNGKIGQCYSFDGINNTITTSASQIFKVQQNTFAIWINAIDLNAYRGLFEIVSANTNRRHARFMSFGDNEIRYHVSYDDYHSDYVSFPNVPLNQWVHLVGTWDGKYLKSYINGNKINEVNFQGIIPYDYNDLRVEIGLDPNRYFNGKMNDFRIYNHALSEKEIKEIAKAKILHYSFNDFQEPTVNLVKHLESPSVISGLETDWRLDKINDTTFKITALKDNPSVSAYGNISGNLSTSYTVPAGTSITISCDILDYRGSLSRIYPSSGGFRTIVGYYRKGNRYGRTITYSSNWTHNLQFRASSVSDIKEGDYVVVSNVQMELKNHMTPFTLSTRDGMVRDISGYRNDSVLSLSTTPQWVNDSKIGSGSYRFNYLTENIITPKVANLQDGVSFSAWFYSYDITKAQNIYSANPSYFVRIINSKMRWSIYANSTWTFGTGSTLLESNKWYHVCMIYDKSSLKGYVNGVLDYSIDLSGRLVNSFNGEMKIGYTTGGENAPFFGLINDVRIYATALSGEDITELYKARASLDNDGNFYINQIVEDVEPTENLYSMSQWGGHASSWVLQTETLNGELIYKNKVTTPNVGNNFGFRILATSRTIPSATTNITLSFWVKLIVDPGFMRGYIRVCYSDGTFQQHGWDYSPNIFSNFATYQNKWTHVAATVTLNSSKIPSYMDYIYVYRDNAPQGEMDISMIQVEFKDHATPFTKEVRPQSDSLPVNFSYGANSIMEQGILNYEEISEIGPTDGLVAYYPLNGNARDYSGNMNHGTVYGAIPVNGVKDQCYSFDGIDNYMQSNIFEEITFNGNYSVSLWFKWNGANEAFSEHILWINSHSTLDRNGLSISNNTIGFQSYDGSKYDGKLFPIPEENKNEWIHVVCISENGLKRLYVNGIESIESGNNYQYNGMKKFCASFPPINGVRNGPFPGLIDEIRIYNRALSEEEVAIMYDLYRPDGSKMKMTNNKIYISGEFKEGF